MRVRRVPLLVLVVVCMMTWMPAQADVFYDMRLKTGHDALVAQRWLEAAESLRIACFGLLDTPKSLTPCLAQLALAQQGLGRTADVDTTLGRIVEVESRFGVYDPALLDPDLRTRFESLMLQRVPRSTLSGIPTLVRIVDPNAKVPVKTAAAAPPNAQPATTPPAQATTAPVTAQPSKPAAPATTAPAQTTAPGPVPASGDTDSPVRKTQSAPASTSVPPTTETKPTRGRADSIEAAKNLLNDGKAKEAKPFLVSAVNRDPGRRELHLLLLQAAVMTADWPLALKQVTAAQPFAENEPGAMFYASIALFENRRESEARDLMSRALSRLAPSTYVDTYAKKVLGR